MRTGSIQAILALPVFATEMQFRFLRTAITFADRGTSILISLSKQTKVPRWENATFGIGFQFFNFLNHPNFGFPTTGLGPHRPDLYLAQPRQASWELEPNWAPIDVAPRMIQLKAELKF
jgi:hypothetical protein